jgi:hypothetical protein
MDNVSNNDDVKTEPETVAGDDTLPPSHIADADNDDKPQPEDDNNNNMKSEHVVVKDEPSKPETTSADDNDDDAAKKELSLVELAQAEETEGKGGPAPPDAVRPKNNDIL